jgi:hypothetical protein
VRHDLLRHSIDLLVLGRIFERDVLAAHTAAVTYISLSSAGESGMPT